MHVLVIDDDALAGELTAAVLEELGHTTVLADSAAAGLDALAQQPPPGLIVCDLHMPGTSGLALFRQLRAGGVALPFVMLSADDPQAVLRQESALDACVLKDFDIAERLQRALADVAAHRQHATGENQP